jgi:hypothetical protein
MSTFGFFILIFSQKIIEIIEIIEIYNSRRTNFSEISQIVLLKQKLFWGKKIQL